jgi:hypothetical protein
MKKTLQTITAGLTALAVLAIFQTVPTHAASFAVATGNDENTDNSSCSLSEAIENINDQAQTNTDCPAGDGVNDTINLPVGTITLVADLPALTKTTTITGAGIGDSIIDGDGQYKAVFMLATAAETLSVADFTVTGFKRIAVEVENSNFNVNRVEVDGNNSIGEIGFALAGFGARNAVASASTTVSINNSYVHHLNDAVQALGVQGVFVYTSDDALMNVSATNITINDIQNTDSAATGFMIMGGIINGGSPSTLDATLDNITISHVRANGNAFGVGVVNYTGAGDASFNVRARNITITDLVGGNDLNFPTQGSTGLVVAGGGASGAGTVNLETSNLLLSGISRSGTPHACSDLFDYGTVFGGSGSFNGSIVSKGGNVTDDTTCAPYFNHAKDQNNLTNLGSTLGPLQNNGGIVPTRALLQGSPAIDAGVTIAGLTSDARGSVRPQGLAYDSGAYESPFSKAIAATSATSNATLASTGQSRITLLLMTATILTASLGAAVFVKRQNI